MSNPFSLRRPTEPSAVPASHQPAPPLTTGQLPKANQAETAKTGVEEAAKLFLPPRSANENDMQYALRLLAHPGVDTIRIVGPGKMFAQQELPNLPPGSVPIACQDATTVPAFWDQVETVLVPLIDPVDGKSALSRETRGLYESVLSFYHEDERGARVKIRARFHGMLPPVSREPSFVIRKRADSKTSLHELGMRGMMSQQMHDLLADATRAGATMLISGGSGTGKMRPLDTLIVTTMGLKPLADIEVGDQVFNREGITGRVTALFDHDQKPIYRHALNTGEVIDCGDEHNFIVAFKQADGTYSEPETWTAQTLYAHYRANPGATAAIPVLTQPLHYPSPQSGIDPAAAWLHPFVTARMVDPSTGEWAGDELFLHQVMHAARTQGWHQKGLHVPSPTKPGVYVVSAFLLAQARTLQLDRIATADPQVRAAFIAGLVDSNGWSHPEGGIGITTSAYTPDERTVLTRILAAYGLVPTTDTTYPHTIRVLTDDVLGYMGTPLDTHVPVGIQAHWRVIESITLTEETAPMRCISVDTPDHTYLAGDTHIPDHNTTLMESLTHFFNETDSVTVVEDAEELVLSYPADVIYMNNWTGDAGAGEPPFTLTELVKETNRQSSTRIIVGELRGPEAADFVTAANSGAEGSAASIHANSPEQALDKSAGMIARGYGMNNTDLPYRDLGFALDLIVQLKRNRLTRRRYVSEIVGISSTLNAAGRPQVSTIWSAQNDGEGFIFHHMPDWLVSKISQHPDIGDKIKTRSYMSAISSTTTQMKGKKAVYPPMGNPAAASTRDSLADPTQQRTI